MKAEKHFQNIYNSNYLKVFGLCRGFVSGNESLAKDLTQEVFIKVWNHLPTFRNKANISTWIYRIAVNTCLQELRKKKYVRLEIDLSSNQDNEKSEKEKKFDKMYGCINKLSHENKSIILLELEDTPQVEIADIIGISHSALRTRIHRIKDQLSKCVKNE